MSGRLTRNIDGSSVASPETLARVSAKWREIEERLVSLRSLHAQELFSSRSFLKLRQSTLHTFAQHCRTSRQYGLLQKNPRPAVAAWNSLQRLQYQRQLLLSMFPIVATELPLFFSLVVFLVGTKHITCASEDSRLPFRFSIVDNRTLRGS